MWRLVPTLVGMMGGAYPELTRANALVTETLRLAEARFKDMLARGLRLLEEETARLGASQALPGEVAFKPYDTSGFPLHPPPAILRRHGRGAANPRSADARDRTPPAATQDQHR